MKNHNYMAQQEAAKGQGRRLELAIVLQCGLAAFVVCMSFYFVGKLGGLVGFNFLSAALGILLAATSLTAKKEWMIRGIAVAGMIIATASAFVNPPWSASTQVAEKAVPFYVPPNKLQPLNPMPAVSDADKARICGDETGKVIESFEAYCAQRRAWMDQHSTSVKTTK